MEDDEEDVKKRWSIIVHTSGGEGDDICDDGICIANVQGSLLDMRKKVFTLFDTVFDEAMGSYYSNGNDYLELTDEEFDDMCQDQDIPLIPSIEDVITEFKENGKVVFESIEELATLKLLEIKDMLFDESYIEEVDWTGLSEDFVEMIRNCRWCNKRDFMFNNPECKSKTCQCWNYICQKHKRTYEYTEMIQCISCIGIFEMSKSMI